MSNEDLSKPIEISADTFWVGQREGSLLERNIYLRVFRQNGRPAVSLLIDPGPPADLMTLTKKVGQVLGNLRNVNLVFANHQDPDVAANAGYLQKLNPNISVVCSEDTWRLIRFYDLDPKRYYATERFKKNTLNLATGHTLRFVPSPFCHFRGATMLYDPETRILYTGDLFGALSYVPDLWADERQWDGIKAFHQIYMPVQEAIALTVQSIRALDPPPLVIAPQHGSLITGPWVEHYLQRLERLAVGLNLLVDSQGQENYLGAMNELLKELARTVGPEPIARAMKVFAQDGSVSSVIQADAQGVRDLKIDPDTAIDIFVRQLQKLIPSQADLVEMATVKVLLGRNIALPEAMRAVQGAASPEFIEIE